MAARYLFPLISACVLLSACAIQPDKAVPDVPVTVTAPPPTTPENTVETDTSTHLAAAEAIQTPEDNTPAAPPPTDLWQALRENFSLPAIDNPRIRTHRNWYAKHPEYMRRVSERAERYAWHIHRELRARDMPAEIALLPIVESAFDPFAYSHGRAAGLWQFIPATGKRYGLTQDWWYDGRRDVIASTEAALDYLQYLHKRFKGDWLLALAAYNSGEGTVSKAQRRNRKRGKPTGFWHLKLPKETRAYVPKLIALAQLVERPGDYGVTLSPIPARAYFLPVDIGGQIDLAVAAELAGMELDALYRLNPGFNQWATAPGGPHRLLVPVERAEPFRQAIAKLPPDERVRWQRHKVKRGETLSHIARRYGTTIPVLQTTNQLKGSTIRAGKHLMVPVASQAGADYKLSAAARLNRQQNTSRKGSKTRHVVKRGDTLWDLSRTYKVGVRSLASWNGMAPGDTLRVGQSLVVWTASGKSGSHPGSRARKVFYTVRKGDSLSRISTRFKVSVTDLRRWNSLPKGKYLQPGQRLKLFVDPTRQAGA